MNRVSQRITKLINMYCSANAISKIASSSFISNLIENFHHDFDDYLRAKYHIRLLDLNTITHGKQPSTDLYLFNIITSTYRPVTQKDVNVLYAIIRKWYQDFDDINLRIKLLFDSKYGTKFLSEKTHVNANIISKTRHNKYPIQKLDGETRLRLENFYLNSKLAKHIHRLKVNFDDI